MGESITVFRSRLRDDVPDRYFDLAAELRTKAGELPGFVEHKVFVAEDGERLTLVTFASAEHEAAWRADSDHRAAQQEGRDDFYDEYDVAVCEVQRRHRWHHRSGVTGERWSRHFDARTGAGEDARVLFLHETHLVRGYHEDDFEAAFRDHWMPTLAEDDDARLLWYCNLAHGSTWSYRVVTVTAVRDGAAYERLARRVQQGDLQDWMRALDTTRHDAHAKVLVPLPWSPFADVDLASVPGGGVDRDPVVYMQDTMWPFRERFADYIEASGSVYSKSLEHRDTGAPRFLEIEAGFQPAFGSHVRREVVLMQRILDLDRLQHLLMTDIPPEMRAPGTWMHDALALRDKWESLLLRTARWSPAPLEVA